MSYFRQLVPGDSNCRSLTWQLAPAAPETARAPTCFLSNDPGQLKEGPTCRHGLCARSLMFLEGGGGTVELSVENIKSRLKTLSPCSATPSFSGLCSGLVGC